MSTSPQCNLATEWNLWRQFIGLHAAYPGARKFCMLCYMQQNSLMCKIGGVILWRFPAELSCEHIYLSIQCFSWKHFNYILEASVQSSSSSSPSLGTAVCVYGRQLSISDKCATPSNEICNYVSPPAHVSLCMTLEQNGGRTREQNSRHELHRVPLTHAF